MTTPLFLLTVSFYVYFNARSLLPKFDNLLSLVHVHNPHIICIVESWLSPEVSDTEICVSRFQPFHFDRNRHVGGVLIYVSVSVSPLPSPPPTSWTPSPFSFLK